MFLRHSRAVVAKNSRSGHFLKPVRIVLKLAQMLKDFVSKTDSMAEKLTAFLKRDRRRVLQDSTSDKKLDS
jgi:hypothetical protein